MTDQDWTPPGFTAKGYPEVYTKRPPPPAVRKPGMIPDDKIDKFFRDGYLVVEDFFDCEKELEPCREALKKEISALAQTLYDAGKIDRLYDEFEASERMQKLEEAFPGACVLFHKRAVLPEEVKMLWTNERLLDVMEQLVGPEVSGNPIWTYRPKVKSNTIGIVPWHQDNAYSDNKAYDSLIITGWIPLVDTFAENGCLQVVKGAHSKGLTARHTLDLSSPTLHVTLPEEEMEKTLGVDLNKDIVTVPVKYGSFLIFTNATPHQSLPNLTDQTRWTVDIRWQASGAPNPFFDIKPTTPFRSAANPDMKVDWGDFQSVLRVAKSEDGHYEETDTKKQLADLEPVITGPWVDKWRKPEA